MELCTTMIILPCLVETKNKLKFPPSHPALLLFDNFKRQRTENRLKLLDTEIINVVLIPPNCTDRLQPLDLSVNKTAKKFCENPFKNGIPSVCSQLEGKTSKEPVDLRLSVMKLLEVKWLVKFNDYVKSKPDIIKNGFKEAGTLICAARYL